MWGIWIMIMVQLILNLGTGKQLQPTSGLDHFTTGQEKQYLFRGMLQVFQILKLQLPKFSPSPPTGIKMT